MTLALALLGASAAFADEVRVATLLPCVEDALRGVPGVRVVASIRASMRAPERTDVVDLGSPHAPNLERLAAANANLVVADAVLDAPLKDELARSGAEVVLLDTSSVDSTFAGLEALGKKVGAPDVLAARVQASRAKLAGEALATPIKVLALFGTPGSFQVVTQGAWLGSLLETLRFENLGAGLTGSQRFPGFAEVSHETLATLHPDLVLLVAHGDPTRIRQELDALMAGSGPWSGLAKASRGVHVLPPDLFVSNPGLGLPQAGQVIAELGARTPAVGTGK
ncbi:MAG TPA: ABC transporter substrate-binding protein [Myxococcota bacterium]|nr:ABC transporter substrate-binding protein [Myxococcota bacterium]